MFNRLTLSASLAALFLAGCDVAGNERTNDQPLGSVEEGAPFDLSAAVRRVKLGYGWEGHAAIVRRGAYSVRAERGRVHFTPRAFAQAPDITDPAHDALSSDALAKLEAKDGAPLVLETVQIARGEAFDLGTGAQSIAEDGALVIDRGVAEEPRRSPERARGRHCPGPATAESPASRRVRLLARDRSSAATRRPAKRRGRTHSTPPADRARS